MRFAFVGNMKLRRNGPSPNMFAIMFQIKRRPIEQETNEISRLKRETEYFEGQIAYSKSSSKEFRLQDDDCDVTQITNICKRAIADRAKQIDRLENPWRHGVLPPRAYVKGIGEITLRVAEQVYDFVAIAIKKNPDHRLSADIRGRLDVTDKTTKMIREMYSDTCKWLDALCEYFTRRIGNEEYAELVRELCDVLVTHPNVLPHFANVKGMTEADKQSERRKALRESLKARFPFEQSKKAATPKTR